MPVTLVIAEKKSVAVDVSKALDGTFKSSKNFLEGPDTVITWAVGHLAELAAPEHYDDKFKRWKMADLPILPKHFDVVPRAEGESAKSQLEAIAKLMKRDDIELIVNACDAGREGELIFAYVLDVAGKKGVPVQRAWFSSMTKDAIRQAFGHLRAGSELAPLEAAARSRSEADWLVGMNATRAATIRGRAAFGSTVVSLGRVQTPTLAILVRREKEIQVFEPTPYWLVDATFQPADKTAYRGRHVRGSETHILTGEDADAIVARVKDGEGHITSLSKRTQRSQPPLLYDLTALQREAASWHGFTARRTLSAAQGCYEKAVLTYPRTASRYLSSDMIPELKEIAGHVGKRSKEYAKGAAYVQGLAELPLGRDRQQREGHGPPRDHPDERAAGRHRALARRAAHLRHGRPALPGRVPSAGRVREHDGADGGRGRELPLARQGHARGRLARRLRRGAARRAEGPGRRERRGRGRRTRSCRRSRRARRCAAPRSPPTRARPSRRRATARPRCWPPWRAPASSSRTTSCARP